MVMAFLLLGTMITLINNFWSGFDEGYNIEQDNLQDEQNVFQKLKGIQMLEGLSEIQEGLFKITALGGISDLLGGLALSGLGILQVIGGVVTLPFELLGIVTNFYGILIPTAITKLLGSFVVITVGFILLSAKMGFEL